MHHLKPYSAFLLVLLTVVQFACKDDAKESVSSSNNSDSLSLKAESAQKEVIFSLNAPLENFNLDQRFLHGTFYNDRAHYYIIKRPNMNIFGSQVDEVTLYFVDSVLARTSYTVHDNISNRMINSLGKFKIKALNDSTRIRLKEEKVVTRENGWYRLNPNLDFYQLIWNRKESDIMFKVHKPEKGELAFSFIEEMNYYKDAIQYIDNMASF